MYYVREPNVISKMGEGVDLQDLSSEHWRTDKGFGILAVMLMMLVCSDVYVRV